MVVFMEEGIIMAVVTSMLIGGGLAAIRVTLGERVVDIDCVTTIENCNPPDILVLVNVPELVNDEAEVDDNITVDGMVLYRMVVVFNGPLLNEDTVLIDVEVNEEVALNEVVAALIDVAE